MAISTSPMLNTLANGSQAGSANRSVSGASAGSGTTMLFDGPAGAPPTDASARGSAGIQPPLATMAARLHPAPTAMSQTPGMSRLRSTTASTATDEAT